MCIIFVKNKGIISPREKMCIIFVKNKGIISPREKMCIIFPKNKGIISPREKMCIIFVKTFKKCQFIYLIGDCYLVIYTFHFSPCKDLKKCFCFCH